jgi:hypothetical protein
MEFIASPSLFIAYIKEMLPLASCLAAAPAAAAEEEEEEEEEEKANGRRRALSHWSVSVAPWGPGASRPALCSADEVLCGGGGEVANVSNVSAISTISSCIILMVLSVAPQVTLTAKSLRKYVFSEASGSTGSGFPAIKRSMLATTINTNAMLATRKPLFLPPQTLRTTETRLK